MKTTSRLILGFLLVSFLIGTFQNCSSDSLSASPTAPSALVTSRSNLVAQVSANAKLAIDCLKAGNCINDYVNVAQHKEISIYAYGGSAIKVSGVYHMFYCSSPDPAGGEGWDNIRHVTSADLNTWSLPDVVVRNANTGTHVSACDPSVVFYNGYYYMYFGSAYEVAPNVYQTFVALARSNTVGGPYLTLDKNGGWSARPTNPKHIIDPVRKVTNRVTYGAGQPTVVVHDGKVKMWFADDTASSSAGGGNEFYIYYAESTDPTTFVVDAASSTTNMHWGDSNSVEVKYDPVSRQFVMFQINPQIQTGSTLQLSYSTNGKTFSASETVLAPPAFPSYAGNIGVASDAFGALTDAEAYVTFGAPFDISPTSSYNNAKTAGDGGDWGRWSLYAVSVKLSIPAAPVVSAPTPTPTPAPSSSSAIVMAVAHVSNPLRAGLENAAIDGNNQTAFSSGLYPDSRNTDYSTWIAAWIAGSARSVKAIKLTARMVSGAPSGFPPSYHLSIVNPEGTAWKDLGTFSTQPAADGTVMIYLAQAVNTNGVWIIPETLGTDQYGGYYFQLAEITLVP